MDRGVQNKIEHDEAEKQAFYKEIDAINSQKIIIYGASVIAKDLLKKLQARNKEVWAFCVSDKKMNCKEIEQIPVLQIDEVSEDICKESVFILAMKQLNQKKVKEKLEKTGKIKYITVPESLSNSTLNLQRVNIPGMEITTKIGCSVNCKYCPQDVLCRKYSEKHQEKLLSISNFKSCLEKLPKETYILFSGFVEPFLNKDCIDMLEYSVQKGYRTSLNTTLVGLSIEHAKRLVKLPLEFLTLHTPDNDEYANIPMTSEYFEVLDFLLDTKKQNGNTFIDVANCQSIPHPQIVKFINNRVPFSNLVILDRAGNLSDTEICESIYHKGKIVCEKSRLLNRNVLLPDGTVVLCCMDFGLQHELGNLLTDSYADIMNGKTMSEVKRCMNDGAAVLCRSCSLAKKV